MIVLPVNWVTGPRFYELTGYTVDACDKKRVNGEWLEGQVWKKAPDGRVLFSIEGYHSWVEGTAFAPQARRASSSLSRISARGAARS